MAVLSVIQFRRGDSVTWIEKNPLLESGEPGYETDTRKWKIGDGTSYWIDLPYSKVSSISDVLDISATANEINALHNSIPGLTSPNKVVVMDNNNNINFAGKLTVNDLEIDGSLSLNELDGGTP